MSATSVHDHDHDHDHGHPHPHPHPPERATVADGPVVLDIGAGFGALVVTLPDAALGTELHARRPGEHHTTHTGVHRRTTPNGAAVTAVFPELVAGTWELLDPCGEPFTEVLVGDGSVALADLR